MKTNRKSSKIVLWISYILQSLIVVILMMGAINNLLQTEMAVQGAVEMGYPKSSVFNLGIVLFIATVLYAIPKTIFIGGFLLTAWLGGAVATHVINNDPILNIIIPVIFGILIWLSILMRNEKMKTMLFLKKNTE